MADPVDAVVSASAPPRSSALWLGTTLLTASAGIALWLLVPGAQQAAPLTEAGRRELCEESCGGQNTGSQATIDLAEPSDVAAFDALLAAAESWKKQHPDAAATPPDPSVLTQALVALLRAQGFAPTTSTGQGRMEMTVGIVHGTPPELVCQIAALDAPVHGLDELRLRLVYVDGGGRTLQELHFPPPPASETVPGTPVFWQTPLTDDLQPPISAATVHLAGQSGHSEALPLVP